MKKVSNLWQKLTSHEFSNIDKYFIENFRSPGAASKFVAWNPYEKSTRYLKFLLHKVASQQTTDFFNAYNSIKNTDLGNPLAITFYNSKINTDYMAAIEEALFLQDSGGLDNVTSVLEIGAGFGRTCHTMLTLFPEISEYIIVDLDPMLNLSKKYLELAIPESLNKIKFVSNDDLSFQKKLKPDLVINIDSFQEMPPSIIDDYMDRIVGKANKFYCKNPIGKYLPESVGMGSIEPEKLLDVFSLGRCTDVIDIFNPREIEKAKDIYVHKYLPLTSLHGHSFEVKAIKSMDLFPYHYHVLYEMI